MKEGWLGTLGQGGKTGRERNAMFVLVPSFPVIMDKCISLPGHDVVLQTRYLILPLVSS